MSDEKPAEPVTSFYKIEQTATENIHNDLGNAAYYYRKHVVEREANGDTDGIKFDMMAGLTMSAFFVEASINYIGKQKITDWNEFQAGHKKLKEVTVAIGLSPDYTSRPWSVVQRLKDFRDTLAHGKPQYLETSRVIVGPRGTAIDHQTLQPEWLGALTEKSVVECYEDANTISLEMFAAAGIPTIEASSGGSISISYEGSPIQGTGMPEGWEPPQEG